VSAANDRESATTDPSRMENVMHPLNRFLLALGILVVDAAVFVVPLGGLFLAYVILSNPPWFRDFLARLDPPPDE